MKKAFMPVLLSCRISGNYINPGDSLWVTLEWQNQGDTAAPREYTFFLAGRFGHQRRPEGKQYDFFVTGGAMPPPTQWGPGETVAVTLKWDCGGDWSGTYWIRTGILDENGLPLPFTGADGAPVVTEELGSIDTSWNLGRPWVKEHSMPLQLSFRPPIISAERIRPDILSLTDGVTAELEKARPALCAIGGKGGWHELHAGIPCAVVRRVSNDRTYREGEADCTVEWRLVELSRQRAVYHAQVFAEGREAAAFDAVWEVQDRTVSITIANRKEQEDFELLELRYPALAELESGYLLDFWGAGRLVPIDTATPAFFEKKYDVRNAAALYDEQGMVLVESLHLDSLLTTGVCRTGGENRGFIGGSVVARVRAGRGVPSIPVKEPPVFTIELPELDGKRPCWQEAAKLLRRGITSNNAHELYRNTYFYKQLATWGPKPAECYHVGDPHPLTQNLFRTVTFDQIAENARGFSQLTDGARQVLYITGWQKGGFDNAYPTPYDAEERCGGLPGLRRCLEELRQYNTASGLHDNFDDISSEKAEDFPYIALDENGEKWRGWIWAAGMTYIMGLRKYVDSGAARERIDRMCRLLPLRETYHLDVLTAEVCRYDYDPAYPASAEDNYRAKLEIIEEFNRHGLDVTSEVLTHPFVGKVGFALHNRIDTQGVYIPGDRFVPLVEMIYHGTIGYCAPSRTKRELLWGILLGGQTFYEENVTGDLCVSRYYLQNIPAMLLYGKRMEEFYQEGDCATAIYEDGSRIEADFRTESYSAVIGGELVGRDFTTLARGSKPGTWLAYSLEGGLLRRPLPEGMSALPRGLTLTVNGKGTSVSCRVEQGDLVVEMPPLTPVRIM